MKVQKVYSVGRLTASKQVLKLAVMLLLGLTITPGCKKSNIVTENSAAATTNASSLKVDGAPVSSNHWYDMLTEYVNTVSSGSSAPYPSSDADVLAWQESYVLSSYVTLYELTKDPSWLTNLTTQFDVMKTHTVYRYGFHEWETSAYVTDGNSYPYMVCDGMICLPVARFIRLVHQDASLSSFMAKADEYQTFIEDDIVPKWTSTSSYVGNCWVQLSSSTGYFREPTARNTHPGYVRDPLPFNQINVWAQMLWTMYDVNSKSDYYDKARGIAQYFKNYLITNGSGYKWKYDNISAESTIEDSSHGNLDIALAIEAFNRGIVFTGPYMQNFRDTYISNMWNGNLTNPLVDDRVDGTSGTHDATKYLYGWTQLSQFGGNPWYIAANQYPQTDGSVVRGSLAFAATLAQLIAWDPLKIVNQGFEYQDCNDLTLPSRWARIGAASASKWDTTNELAGKACAKVVSPADGTWVGLYQVWKGWQANTTYQVTLDVKTTATNGTRVFMTDVTTGLAVSTTQKYSNTSWTNQTFTFTTPSNVNDELRLYLENGTNTAASTTYFDNVKIKKSGDAF